MRPEEVAYGFCLQEIVDIGSLEESGGLLVYTFAIGCLIVRRVTKQFGLENLQGSL